MEGVTEGVHGAVTAGHEISGQRADGIDGEKAPKVGQGQHSVLYGRRLSDAPNPLGSVVDEGDGTGRVGDDRPWPPQEGVDGRSAIAVESAGGPRCRTGTGDRRDGAVGGDLADPVVSRVAEVEVPDEIDRDAPRGGQSGSHGWPAVAAEGRLFRRHFWSAPRPRCG
jgi:hypothetical protein